MSTTLNPTMFPATVRFPDESVADIPGEVARTLQSASLPVTTGTRVAVAVGSRGIGSIAAVVKAAVEWLKSRGAEPFIVPAMGSHGGATAEGQAAVLASYGVTETSMGVPVLSSMDTVRLGSKGLETELFMDRYAWEADGVLLVNRVKPHTDFHGFPESGLVKMSVIGLGKHDQALAVHGHGIRGLKELILPAFRGILSTGKIIGGLAIVENAYDEPLRIQAMSADDIEPVERELLEIAHSAMARLPLEDIDVLIVDELGKDVSGTGLDTNVIGRIKILGEAEPDAPRIRSIIVTRLTEASHGNALGTGLADVITRELYDQIDFGAMYENGWTSSFADRIHIPYVASDLAEAFRAGVRFAGLGPNPEAALETARIVRIKNTLELSSILVSQAAAEAIRSRAGALSADVSADGVPLFASRDGAVTFAAGFQPDGH